MGRGGHFRSCICQFRDTKATKANPSPDLLYFNPLVASTKAFPSALISATRLPFRRLEVNT